MDSVILVITETLGFVIGGAFIMSAVPVAWILAIVMKKRFIRTNDVVLSCMLTNSAIAFLLTMLATGTGFNEEQISPLMGLVVGGVSGFFVAGIVALVFALVRSARHNTEAVSTPVSAASNSIKDSVERVSRRYQYEPQHYAVALDEYETGKTEKGALAIAIVNSNGNQTRLQPEYIKIRAKHLSRAQRSQ